MTRKTFGSPLPTQPFQIPLANVFPPSFSLCGLPASQCRCMSWRIFVTVFFDYMPLKDTARMTCLLLASSKSVLSTFAAGISPLASSAFGTSADAEQTGGASGAACGAACGAASCGAGGSCGESSPSCGFVSSQGDWPKHAWCITPFFLTPLHKENDNTTTKLYKNIPKRLHQKNDIKTMVTEIMQCK